MSIILKGCGLPLEEKQMENIFPIEDEQEVALDIFGQVKVKKMSESFCQQNQTKIWHYTTKLPNGLIEYGLPAGRGLFELAEDTGKSIQETIDAAVAQALRDFETLPFPELRLRKPKGTTDRSIKYLTNAAANKRIRRAADGLGLNCRQFIITAMRNAISDFYCLKNGKPIKRELTIFDI